MSSRSITSGQGGGGNGSTPKNWNKNPATHVKLQASASKFHGACEALKDMIFDCLDYKQADGYVNTVKCIGEYVGAEYQHGGDIRASIVNEKLFEVPHPGAPTTQDPNSPTADELVDMKIFDKEIDAYIKRKGILADNVQKAYSLMIGQCTDLL